MSEIKIAEILEDIADANDRELHIICGLEHYGDARQKMLRLARRGDIPAHPWDGRWLFFKSEVQQHMAERYETV
jgi:hypothetical protein